MRFRSISASMTLAAVAALAPAQTPSTPARVVGVVTAISGQSVTVKPDAGTPVTFSVSETAHILETQPGATTLAGAVPIALSDIAMGDRVLAAVRAGSEGSTLTATTLIAMKGAAVAEHQQAEAADWQRRGVGGLVKSVDAAAGTLTIASGARTLTIRMTPKTIFRRYSADSIKFSDTKASTLDVIRPGDQLRVRGDRNADGSGVTADEIVSGNFRNIAGKVISVDPGAATVTVTDLATNKPVVIHINAESQMHKLPEQMAQFLAMRLKQADSDRNSSGQPPENRRPDAGSSSSAHQNGGDLSQMIQRAPVVSLTDLHKGDAVMIVATEGTSVSATAVTLVAGVEPLLTASPSASQSMFSASWNVGGGGDAGAGGAADGSTP
jgi:hypothetical protein